MVSIEHADIGAEVEVATALGQMQATVVERPFYDPKKKIAVGQHGAS
jgi:aminomethyltransferase